MQIAIGLLSRDTSAAIMTKDYETLNNLLSDIRELEEFQKERRDRFGKAKAAAGSSVNRKSSSGGGAGDQTEATTTAEAPS